MNQPRMVKYLFIGLFSLLIMSTNNAFAQKILSKDQVVMNPYLDLKNLPDQDSSLVLRKYLPFDDVTLFTTIIGAKVYSDNKLDINMVPLAGAKGDVKGYNRNIDLGLQFFINSKLNNSETFVPETITFLINGERYQKKVLDNGVTYFDDHNIYLALTNVNKVRARIEGEKNKYEINMSYEVRDLIKTLIQELKSNK